MADSKTTADAPDREGWGWIGDVCAVWGRAIVLGETFAEKETRARLMAAAPDLATALAALVKTFHARPDMLRLCGFHEHAQIQAACDALNKAGVQNV